MLDIKVKLNELGDLQAARDVAKLDMQQKIDVIMEQVREQIDAVKAEYDPLIETATERESALVQEIKHLVIENGFSVKGDHLHAVYTKGRVTWDTKKLDGLMIVLPQLSEARREGEPGVSIRNI